MSETTEDAGTVPGGEGAPAPEAESTATAPAETQEAETETEGEQEEQPDKPTRQPWFQKRIGQLTARTAALEAELAAARAQAEGKKPAETDIERIAEEIAAKKVRERELLDAANRTAEAGAKEFKDWEQARSALVSNFSQEIQAKPEFLDAVTALDNGHAVFRHLGLNPEEADRILSLPSAKMGVELAKLGTKLAAKPAPQVSKAPKPIKPITGSATPEKDPDSMTMDEWKEWRRAQLRKR